MRTAYKCRAYPDPEQATMFARTFGCVRLVWNMALAERYRAHLDGGKISYKQTDAALTGWKKTEQFAFLSEVSSVPLQQTLRHQHAAFAGFFAGRAGRPRFKSRNSRQSAHYTRSAFRMKTGELLIAKTSTPLMFVWSFEDVDLTTLDPTMVVVSRDPDGRWYVTFSANIGTPEPTRSSGREIGVARYQRRMARCQRGSRNRRKARAKVARAHRKVRAARRDFLHRTSTRLVREADTIVIEDLAVKNMVKNRNLSRAISDCGWGEFRRQLEYKTERAGSRLVVIDRWYPSSKTCSRCGHVLGELKLSTRRWTCPGCRTRHDRDVNAAKNILAAGRAVVRGDSGDACGAGVSRRGSSLPRSAVKQETPRSDPGRASGGPP